MSEEAHARNTDPEGSHDAAAEMEDSGARKGHEMRILIALKDYHLITGQWPTANQLEGHFIACSQATHGATLKPLSAVQINRRIAGMREQNDIHTRVPEGRTTKEQIIILGPDPDPPKKDVTPCVTPQQDAHKEFLLLKDQSVKALIGSIIMISEEIGTLSSSRQTKCIKWKLDRSVRLLGMLRNLLLERVDPQQPTGKDLIGEGLPKS